MHKSFHIIILCMILASVVVACGKRMPKEVIDSKKMEDLLIDIHKSEAFMESDYPYYAKDNRKDSIRNAILAKHGVTRAEFDTSLVWYGMNIEKYIEIYKKVIERLQEEDNKIKHLVQINGEKAWKVIASEFPDRSPRQCRERWKNYLSPTVRNLPWTPEEDAKLAELFSQFGPQWAKIASLFNARTDVNVKNRWSYLKRKEKRIKSTKQYQTNEAQNFNQNKNSAISISNNDVIGNYTQEVIGPPNNQTKALGNSQNNSQINQQMNQKSDQQQKDKDNNEIESS